jgi:hypothetical protein
VEADHRPGDLGAGHTAAKVGQQILDLSVDAGIEAGQCPDRGDVAGLGDDREFFTSVQQCMDVFEWCGGAITRLGSGGDLLGRA